MSVLFLRNSILVLLIWSTFPTLLFAECDKECQKLSLRAVKQYGSKIEQAEDNSCKVDISKPRRLRLIEKSCKKAIRYLDIRYEGYSGLIKSNSKISELRKRHLDLIGRLSNIRSLVLASEVKSINSSSNDSLDYKKFFQ